MTEADLRRIHRGLGIMVALFLVFQVTSGLFLSFGGFSTPHIHAGPRGHIATMDHHDQHDSTWHEALESLHHGGKEIGSTFRILVGTGTLAVAVTGSIIFFMVRARSRKKGA